MNTNRYSKIKEILDSTSEQKKQDFHHCYGETFLSYLKGSTDKQLQSELEYIKPYLCTPLNQ